MREGHYCRLHSGRASWPKDPRPSDIHIADITHALSHLCRFNGHCRKFYSVAEHSVLCSYIVPREYALEALLHDAVEAYCGDMVMPLKRCMPEFLALERKIDEAVRDRFGLPKTMSEPVLLADRRMVHLEFLELMNHTPEDLLPMEPLAGIDDDVVIMCAGPDAMRPAFYRRFLELGGIEYAMC